MNNPYEMHIIETQIMACEALLFRIPSPFSANTIITSCIQLCAQEDNLFHAEYWGDLPNRLPNVPPRRILLAEGTFPFPKEAKATYHEFMGEITKNITNEPFFVNGTKRLLELHREHLNTIYPEEK